MYTEVLPGMYLCKSHLGVTYCLVNKEVYDQIHIQNNSQSPEIVAKSYEQMLELKHLLTGRPCAIEFHKIVLLEWKDLSKNYQLDAIASNEEIRKKYYEEFYGTKPNQVSQDLKGKLFLLVDRTTSTFRTLRSTGEVVDSPHASKVPVLEVARYIHSDAIPLSELSSTGFESADNHAGVGGRLSARCTTNNSGNNSHFEEGVDKKNTMDLLSSIPGMQLSFGKLAPGLIAITYNGDVAFSDKKGGFVTIQHEGTEKTRIDVGSLKLDVDFYKVPTREVEEDDIILLDGDFLIAGKKANGETKFINPITGATTNKLQRSNVLNMYFYTKIVSILDMAGGLNGGPKGLGLGGLNPMTLMLLSGQGGLGQGGDLSKLLLFSQLGQGGGDTNSMLPLLLMSGGLGGNGQNGGLEQLMLMQAMSGNKGGLGSLFGGKKKAAPTKASAKKAPVKGTKKAATAKA